MSEIVHDKAVTYVAQGYRDVYWCYLLNEPVIVTYDVGAPDQPACTNCNGAIKIDDGLHAFICHIKKPGH